MAVVTHALVARRGWLGSRRGGEQMSVSWGSPPSLIVLALHVELLIIKVSINAVTLSAASRLFASACVVADKDVVHFKRVTTRIVRCWLEAVALQTQPLVLGVAFVEGVTLAAHGLRPVLTYDLSHVHQIVDFVRMLDTAARELVFHLAHPDALLLDANPVVSLAVIPIRCTLLFVLVVILQVS